MKLLDSLRFRIATLFPRSETPGLDRAQAERRARIEFGGHHEFKEESHEGRGGILSALLYRMCASVFACCASLPDSPSPPY